MAIDNNCLGECLQFILRLDYEPDFSGYQPDECKGRYVTHQDQMVHLAEIVRKLGYAVVETIISDADNLDVKPNADAPFIMIAKTLLENSHAVVCLGKHIIYDPNPVKGLMLWPWKALFFVPLYQEPQKARCKPNKKRKAKHGASVG